MSLFQAKLIKKFLVKVFIYVKNKPFLILTVVAISYLARLLFRLLISSWGGIENSTILDSQNTTACSEDVQERPPNFLDQVEAFNPRLQKYLVEVVAHTNRLGLFLKTGFLRSCKNLYVKRPCGETLTSITVKKRGTDVRRIVWILLLMPFGTTPITRIYLK